MINLSFDELRLIAQLRNISSYENKSKEDLIKALSEPKPETPKPETPKTKTPKTPETEPKITVKTDKRKLKNLKKDFDELRHKFDKEEIDRYREYFYVAKNKKYLSESEMNKKNKNLNELEKSLILKKIQGNDVVSVYYEDLDYYYYHYYYYYYYYYYY